jgi:hypothetical protein
MADIGTQGGDEPDSPEIRKLKAAVQDLNIVDAIAGLPNSSLANWLQTQTDAYIAWAGDRWSDDGLAAWVASRQAEMNAALRADVAIVTGDMAQRPEVEAPDREAILAAGAAWERDGADLPQRHYAILTRAVLNRRGPFAQFLARQMAACRPGEDPNQRIALHRDEMRQLFHADARAVIREARDQ